MNQYDAELIRDMLEASGYSFVKEENQADIVLLQTCSVRESAENKVFNNINLLLHKKKKKKDLIIGVCGCMAENHYDLIRKNFPGVQVLCGPNNYVELPYMLENAVSDSVLQKNESDLRNKYPMLTSWKSGTKFQAYVAITRGCNNFCSYCVVPYVRGNEISRPYREIIEEIKVFVDNGCIEVTLLGQNVNSYGKDMDFTFVKLLEKINSINGLKRIRFLTSHPKDADNNLFYAIRDLEKVCPSLHLPMQSGSDKILNLMNRKYTLKQYFDKIDSVKSIVPDICLSSDFIVGFPGESEDDFNKTCEAMDYVKYDSSFIFKYSPREGTAASKLEDNVDCLIKEDRNRVLLKIQEKLSLKNNQKYIDNTVEVLVEGKSKRNPEKLSGRTPGFKNVVFEGNENLIGTLVNVKIQHVTPLTLFGDLYHV